MLYQLVIPASLKALKNLESILDKGVAYATTKKVDPDVLANSRLIMDQFHLVRQVQIACDTAKLGAARLTGKEAPKHDDSEKTIDECKARIRSVQDYLSTLTAKDFEGAEERQITQPRWEGKWLSGYDYAHEHVLPNLYFHVTTAYAILRHNGVDLGKKDYLGEMPFQL